MTIAATIQTPARTLLLLVCRLHLEMTGEDYTESKLAIIHIWTNIY